MVADQGEGEEDGLMERRSHGESRSEVEGHQDSLCYNNSNSYCFGSLLCARHCAKLFSCIICFNPHKTYVR